MKLEALALVVAALVAGGGAHAEIASQKNLNLAAAKNAIAAAVAYGRTHDAPGAAIAVVDAGGNLLALERLETSRSAKRAPPRCSSSARACSRSSSTRGAPR